MIKKVSRAKTSVTDQGSPPSFFLRGFIGKTVIRISHCKYYFNNEPDIEEDGDLEVKFNDGSVLTLSILGDGESMVAKAEPMGIIESFDIESMIDHWKDLKQKVLSKCRLSFSNGHFIVFCNAGVEAIRKFTQNIQQGAKILDIGCGYGFPIANTLSQLGFKPYGIDSSIKMVTRFKEDLPDVPVQCSNILNSDFFNTLFDAVIAYGFIFHLPLDQQTKVIEKVSEHLKCKGYFLFSSGDEDGMRMTPPECNGGERFMTYSMSCSNYERILKENSLILKNHYIEKDFRGTIYIAKKLSYKAN